MRILKHLQNIALSAALAGGMAGIPAMARMSNLSSGEIRSAQQELKYEGYYYGPIDGMDSHMTRSAIRHFQRDNGLYATGRLNARTLNKLGVERSGEASRSIDESIGNAPTYDNPTYEWPSSRPYAQGSGYQNPMSSQMSQSQVMAVQSALRQRGLYNGNINGVMDSQTVAAITQFQRNQGFTANGNLDQQTMSALGLSGNPQQFNYEQPQTQAPEPY